MTKPFVGKEHKELNIGRDEDKIEIDDSLVDKREKYVFGRPTLYRPEFCAQLIEWMSKGNSFWTFASKVRTTMTSIDNWCKQYPDFLEAKRIGQALEYEWYEKVMRKMIMTNEGNSKLLMYAQMNKFPRFYKDRSNQAQNNQNLQINSNNVTSTETDIKCLVNSLDKDQMHEMLTALLEKNKEIENGDE